MIVVDEFSLITTCLQLSPRCSTRASAAVSARHWRTDVPALGRPLISHRPGLVWASAAGRTAAASSKTTAPPTPSVAIVRTRAIDVAFTTKRLTSGSREARSGYLVESDWERQRAKG